MATPFQLSGKRITRNRSRVNRFFVWIAVSLAASQFLAGAAMATPTPATAATRPGAAPVAAEAETTVSITAASGESIVFLTQNGQTVDGARPQKLDLPRLVLRRNGQLTASAERTLFVAVNGLDVDPSGALLTVALTTLHPDPDAGDQGQPILIERETTWVAGEAVTLTLTIDDAHQLPTPTDYYSLALTIAHSDGRSAILETPVALLLESQWIASLPMAEEDTPGAAPDSLVIYYTDMVPFQRVAGQPSTRILRSEVDSFVGDQLAPEMVEAFRVQSNEWGFTWHAAWTGFRGGEDAERLSVALSDGATWFHGVAPHGANSTISINVNGGLSGSYATLVDGIVSVFHHELFHNLQRSMRQDLAGLGDVDGPERAWAFITEGMAVAAQSVARPDLEYSAGSETRAIYSWSNAFVTGAGHNGEALNNSYAGLNPYQGALYWRFLFEAAGGLKDPAAGMAPLRNVLETLYSKEVVDVETTDDLVHYLPGIVDRALARTPTAPFRSYRASLRSFARSIYGGAPAGSGLYDPGQLFARPAAERITFPPTAVRFDPQNLPAPHGIGSSYGIDYVEINLVSEIQGLPVEIEVRGAEGSVAEFDVQLLAVDAAGRTQTADPAAGNFVAADPKNGRVANLTLDAGDEPPASVVLIIVRVDNREAEDGKGRYEIDVRPVYS